MDFQYHWMLDPSRETHDTCLSRFATHGLVLWRKGVPKVQCKITSVLILCVVRYQVPRWSLALLRSTSPYGQTLFMRPRSQATYLYCSSANSTSILSKVFVLISNGHIFWLQVRVWVIRSNPKPATPISRWATAYIKLRKQKTNHRRLRHGSHATLQTKRLYLFFISFSGTFGVSSMPDCVSSVHLMGRLRAHPRSPTLPIRHRQMRDAHMHRRLHRRT